VLTTGWFPRPPVFSFPSMLEPVITDGLFGLSASVVHTRLALPSGAAAALVGSY
jgi:hypothetical protein